MCMYVSSVCMSVCYVNAVSVGGQKRALDPNI